MAILNEHIHPNAQPYEMHELDTHPDKDRIIATVRKYESECSETLGDEYTALEDECNALEHQLEDFQDSIALIDQLMDDLLDKLGIDFEDIHEDENHPAIKIYAELKLLEAE